MSWPIYIPTLGRYGKSPRGRPMAVTFRTFSEVAGQLTAVVEPHEVEEYRKALDPAVNILSLPKSGGGLMFARSFIMAHAIAAGSGWFWMIDDDIDRIFVSTGDKITKCNPHHLMHTVREVLSEAIKDGLNVAQLGLTYCQQMRGTGKRYTANRYCDVATAYNPELCAQSGAVFNQSLPVKGDRDYSLQLITSGYSTIRINGAGFSCPPIGSNRGGLFKQYSTPGATDAAVAMMTKRWPGVAHAKRKKDGSLDVGFDWRALNGESSNESKSTQPMESAPDRD